MRSQAGQATVEWVGLVLLVALALGALAAVGLPFVDRGLGTAVAKRMTCAAWAACGGPVSRSELGVSTPAGTANRLGAAAPPPARTRRLGAAAPPPIRTRSRTRVVDAFRRLRGVVTIARRLWIVCIGYRRYVYERDHPRAPHEPMPLDEALDIADACFNPIGFVEDG